MHLLCRDIDCVGNTLPAGAVEDEVCGFCGGPLADDEGQVVVQGPAPLVNGEPPEDFNALMDALRDSGCDVEVIELSAVRVGDKLLVSALREDGELAAAEVCEGPRADEVAHVMGLLGA